MSANTPPGVLRPVKLLLPPESVHQMDRCIYEGRGGYANRHELVRDAIDHLTLELLYGEAADDTSNVLEDTANRPPSGRLLAGGLNRPPSASAGLALRSAMETALTPVVSATPVENELATVKQAPLLGLHNRDWPTLWGLRQLADICAQQPVPLREAYAAVTERAWELARGLRTLETESKVKLTALLPSNDAKPAAAEEGFQAFALGTVARRPRPEDGTYDAAGPLYLWGALGLVAGDKGVNVGVTAAGLKLLALSEGLTVEPPHPEEKTKAFLDYLRTHAAEDWWGFASMLEAVDDAPTRTEYLRYFVDRRDWKESVGTAVAQGYLARGREWGLVMPKLVDGRYTLTDFGEAFLAGLPNNGSSTVRGQPKSKSVGNRPPARRKSGKRAARA